jgi:hypothetical protein
MNQELSDPQATFAPALNQRSIRLAALAAARRSKQPLHASMPGGVGISCPAGHNSGFSDPHASNAAHHSNNCSNFSASWAHPAPRKENSGMGRTGSGFGIGSMHASTGAQSAYAWRRGRSASPRRFKGLEPSDSKDCTFAPATNQSTDAYLQKAGIPATFEERQAFYEQRRKV